ncbi:MAG: DNA-directed RNA polymerase subunit beta', partial [Candidatus Woesebacteria bacterium]
MEPLVGVKSLSDFKSLKIRLASPDEMRKWSRGEVLKPETINYRTLKPEKDGLFDERIFGPTKDWECYCGKYKRIRYKGVVCDKCGVEVTQSRVRRERMGHISLASPVVHVWFFKGAPSRVSLLLNVSPRAIEQVIYFARYLVLEVREKERKEALKHLEESFDERAKEIKNLYEEREKQLKEKSNESKEKIKEKIKDKEQLTLALSEVDLNLRK